MNANEIVEKILLNNVGKIVIKVKTRDYRNYDGLLEGYTRGDLSPLRNGTSSDFQSDDLKGKQSFPKTDVSMSTIKNDKLNIKLKGEFFIIEDVIDVQIIEPIPKLIQRDGVTILKFYSINHDGFIYQKKVLNENSDLYWGTNKDGFVSFFCHDKNNEKGFCERIFTLNMEDNTIVNIRGPWSSRDGAMNKYFPHVMETTDGICLSSILISKVEEILEKYYPDKKVIRKDKYSDLLYDIVDK